MLKEQLFYHSPGGAEVTCSGYSGMDLNWTGFHSGVFSSHIKTELFWLGFTCVHLRPGWTLHAQVPAAGDYCWSRKKQPTLESFGCSFYQSLPQIVVHYITRSVHAAAQRVGPRRASARRSHNAPRAARHWRGTMMAAVGAPEVITQLESAAKVLMVRTSTLFSPTAGAAKQVWWGEI